jgi:tetratricopeptide (TPR) repeat protein
VYSVVKIKVIPVCLLLAASAFAQLDLQPARSVSAEQLAIWIIAETPDWKIASRVRQQGIYFRPTAESLADLKLAGASSSVLEAVRRARSRGKDFEPTPLFQALVTAAGAVQARDYQDGARQIALVLSSDPSDPRPYLAIGRLLVNAGKFNDAARTYRKAIELAPDDIDAHIGLAYAYYRVGDGVKAESAARAALQIDPQDPEAHKNLGLAMEAQGQLEAAEAQFRQALTIEETTYGPEHQILAGVLSQLSDLLRQMGKPEEADKFQARREQIESARRNN